MYKADVIPAAYDGDIEEIAFFSLGLHAYVNQARAASEI